MENIRGGGKNGCKEEKCAFEILFCSSDGHAQNDAISPLVLLCTLWPGWSRWSAMVSGTITGPCKD